MKRWSGNAFKIMALVFSGVGAFVGFIGRSQYGVSSGIGKTLYFTSIVLVFIAIIPELIWMFKED